MGGAIIKRLIVAVPMLIGSSIIVFMILRLVPGDPASAVLGADATPQLVRQVREQLGLDHPIYAQYVSWLGGVLHGSFGHDYISDQSIASELASRLPVTMELAGLAFLISAACAIPLGVFAAVHFGPARLIAPFRSSAPSGSRYPTSSWGSWESWSSP